MKHLKTLGFAAIAAAALMAFAGPASATELTSPEKTMVTTNTTIVAESENEVTLDSPIGEIKCDSVIQSKTRNTGGAGESVEGQNEVLEFNNCTNGADVTIVGGKMGILIIHSIAGTSNGTVTSTGTEVTVELFGAHCIFKTNATDIGTLTGGGPAVLDIVNARIPRVGGRSGALCGSSAPWTGSYKVTSPNPLLVD